MAGNERRKNGHKRDRIREYWKAQELPCALCGKPIDYTLNHLDEMAFEVDEIDSLWKGGDPLDVANTQPAHRRCNRLKYQQERQECEYETDRRSFRPLKSSGEF